MIWHLEFSFVNDLSLPSVSLTEAQQQIYRGLGLTDGDLEALTHALALWPWKEAEMQSDERMRPPFLPALVHYRSEAGREILNGLHRCLDEIASRDYPRTVGADSIFGKARCDIRGFETSNVYRPFYTRILAAQRPEDAERITINESWADYLRLAQWAPMTTGGDS